MELSKVYLKVNEKGETENVFATLGRAIDDLALEGVRIDENLIKSKTISSLKWQGRDGKSRSYEIKEAPICKDVNFDYMDMPRTLTL